MRPNGIQGIVVLTVAGVCIAVVGFLAGRAIGDGNSDDALSNPVPTEISTGSSSIAVPTLGSEKPLPTLEVTQPPAEPEGEEEAVDSGSSEAEPEIEAEPEEPSSSQEQGPEVTVAPNG